MNLYDLHDKPHTVYGHDRADKEVPSIFWGKYQPDELKKREPALAKSARYAYANFALHKPWPSGEAIIAKSPEYAYLYAKEVLHGRFPKGEDAIATIAHWSFEYAYHVLKGPFPKGEKAILDSSFADAYRLNLEIYKDKE